jgi:hypothetical protein
MAGRRGWSRLDARGDCRASGLVFGPSMGTSVCFVAVRAPRDMGQIGDAEQVAAHRDGWAVYQAKPKRWLYPRELEEMSDTLAAAAGGPALGAMVEDSDLAYVVATTADGVAARLLFGAELAEDYQEGAEALELMSHQSGNGPALLEMWSHVSGRAIPAATVEELVSKDWTYSEDAVQALFDALGVEIPWDRLTSS